MVIVSANNSSSTPVGQAQTYPYLLWVPLSGFLNQSKSWGGTWLWWPWANLSFNLFICAPRSSCQTLTAAGSSSRGRLPRWSMQCSPEYSSSIVLVPPLDWIHHHGSWLKKQQQNEEITNLLKLNGFRFGWDFDRPISQPLSGPGIMQTAPVLPPPPSHTPIWDSIPFPRGRWTVRVLSEVEDNCIQ